MKEDNKITTLDKLQIGKDAVITEVKCDDKSLRSHILNMGLTPNVEVTLIKTAPMGDPLETTWVLNKALINDPRCKIKTYWLDRD